MSIPRDTNPSWPLFALAHFKPFGLNLPLLESNGLPVQTQFLNYKFDAKAEKVLRNWNAIHECEDERDADRLRKQEIATRESQTLTSALANQQDVDDVPYFEGIEKSSGTGDFRTWNTINKLQEASWFDTSNTDKLKAKNENGWDTPNSIAFGTSNITQPMAISPTLLQLWKKSIKTQETTLIQQRRSALNPEGQSLTVANDSLTVEGFNTNNYSIQANIWGQTHSTSSNETSMKLSGRDIFDAVINEFQLNTKQTQAFEIIAQHYVRCYINNHPDEKPLRMLMTGPGGTGKTHIVKAVKKVMSFYGHGHRIRFLAPTGSAASNIDGMTVHKGLGIKISRKDGRGKGNRPPGSSSEDYTALVSVQNKTALRDEWRNVDIVLIDEVSLTSSQLLCEIDHALRVAKEMPNDWFGGISVIFAGDFFQYPPVGGTPLYSPIYASHSAQTTSELMKRLGRLAWKSVDTVVELNEQQRMKEDYEYGQAVQCLRIRRCIVEDVDMFNSRVIKTSGKAGIDMGINENINAAAIVSTNHLREVLNAKKAFAMGQKGVITCAARDEISSKELLTLKESEYLLKLNLGSLSTSQQVLPGIVHLYEGMPAILRCRNISTELKITNGSQGVVRHIKMEITEHGHSYCSCAIVEFPDSPIMLEGLRRGWFPIEPSKFKFAHKMKRESSGEEELLRITRFQLPIQPSFAVTGHSAQGKTLLKVLAFLDDGGFGAYVAASRARTREGLCIVNRVTLEDLNKPIPSDLMKEVKRLNALEHNTSIRYGYTFGEIQQVPEPESENSATSAKYTFFYESKENSLLTKPKRRRSASIGYSSRNKDLKCENQIQQDAIPAPNKRLKVHYNNTPSQENFGLIGCQWSSANWSCAYDSLFMILYSSFTQLSLEFQTEFSIVSDISNGLAHSFQLLSSEPNQSAGMFDNERDKFRDILFAKSPSSFQRYGPNLASVTDILDWIFPIAYSRNRMAELCSDDCMHRSLSVHLPSVITDSSDTELDLNSYLSNWIMRNYQAFNQNSYPSTNHSACFPSGRIHGQDINTQSDGQCQSCQSILYFEFHPNVLCLPSKTLDIPCQRRTCSYRLTGIVYYGDVHFNTRLILQDGTIWVYNGQVNSGRPTRDREITTNSAAELVMLRGKKAHVLVYSHS